MGPCSASPVDLIHQLSESCWRREITITADSAIDYTAGIEGVVAIPAALRFPPTVALVRNNLSRMHIQSGSCRGAADHDRCIRSER